ncbi:unnamed protein product, partial [Amoebophrya sp. A25]
QGDVPQFAPLVFGGSIIVALFSAGKLGLIVNPAIAFGACMVRAMDQATGKALVDFFLHAICSTIGSAAAAAFFWLLWAKPQDASPFADDGSKDKLLGSSDATDGRSRTSIVI